MFCPRRMRLRDCLARRLHPPDAFADPDPDRAIGLTPCAEGHFVAVLEEGAGFTARQFQRLLAAAADLQKRAEPAVVVGRKRAGPDQIARLEVAAVRAVMRDD